MREGGREEGRNRKKERDGDGCDCCQLNKCPVRHRNLLINLFRFESEKRFTLNRKGNRSFSRVIFVG